MEIAIKIVVAVLVVIVTGVIALQYKSFKQWLVWAVCEAEKYLGSGTGQLKLKYAYDLAVSRFPFITKIITFNLFSKLVDKALETMRTMIENSVSIKEVLTNGTNDK